ncbi:telomeric single stranded DNA binding domain-containing protein [Chloropicon primus]|uniref:Uncharacterized protein n=1 Tax=Chloropicon primus TaxID=1764295 RepID=A0A5B8MYL5_9CHLO|nr:hypothetical protein A3770_14p72300 [Chloropicon primus]UPR03917.1 telomeric single stranded DNA binding domain-containing protein [Chloropicon primus]|eukprot:QDZ24712.1 hypothetical protein A3770_14p72300 [Chloropicon primus]
MMGKAAATTTTGPKETRSGGSYEYTTIRNAYDAIVHGHKNTVTANLYCTILECSNVRSTKGTDQVVNLKVADATTSEMDYHEGVELLCFSKDESRMPLPESKGDIIRMHRVTVQEWNGKPQLVGRMSQSNGKAIPFSFLLFRGNRGSSQLQFTEEEDFKPYKISSVKTYSKVVEVDKERIRELRGQGAQLGGTAVAAAGPKSEDYSRTLEGLHEVNASHKVDILCKVVFLRDEGAFGVITFGVWDGTDVKPVLARDETRDEDKGALIDAHPEVLDLVGGRILAQDHPAVVAKLAERVRQGDELKYGSIVLVRVPETLRDAVKYINPDLKHKGSWVQFRQLRTYRVDGQVQALYTRESSWTPEDEDGDLVRSAREKAERNLVSTWIPGLVNDDHVHVRERGVSVHDSLTRTRHAGQRYSTIREIVCSEGLRTPSKYHVLARIIGYGPKELEDFCRPKRKKDGTEAFAYSVVVRIEDSTGVLDAQLVDPVASDLFGVTPRDLRRDKEAKDKVASRRDELLGYYDDYEEGKDKDKAQWLELCVFSFFPNEGGGSWANYRLFDTTWKKEEEEEEGVRAD